MITYRFFRHYVDMVEGSVNAAVMLSFAMDKQVNLMMDEGLGSFGYWKFTQDDWFKSNRAVTQRVGDLSRHFEEDRVLAREADGGFPL